MSEVKVNSVQPSEVGPDMVAYLLTVSILSKGDTTSGFRSADGLPIISGQSEEAILRTYAKARLVVGTPSMIDDFLGKK